jgi:hypothetical protein
MKGREKEVSGRRREGAPSKAQKLKDRKTHDTRIESLLFFAYHYHLSPSIIIYHLSII